MAYPEHLNHPIIEPEIKPDAGKSESPAHGKVDNEEMPTILNADKEEKSSQWSNFVNNVAKTSNHSLVSLLRNSVILDLNEVELVIGYTNSKLYSPEKIEIIEQAARSFFNPSIKVIFRESNDGIDLSLKDKQDIADRKKKKEIKKKASQDTRVKKVLELFPNSIIDSIKILKE